MNRLSAERRTAILGPLCEGSSINATARLTGVSKVTILKLLADVGTACLDYQRRVMVSLPCKRLQCDEIWSFVGMKEKAAKSKGEDRPQNVGDVWTWTGIEAQSKDRKSVV